MANPQVENGHTRIANELLEALAKATLCGAAFRIVTFIIRQTYGWHQTAARITQAQMAAATGMKPQTLNRELKLLINRSIVVRLGDSYALNKDYDTWDRVRHSRRKPTAKQDMVSTSADTTIISTCAESQSAPLLMPKSTCADTGNSTSAEHKRKKETTSKKSSKIGAPSAIASAAAFPKPPSDHQTAVDFWCSEYQTATGVKYAFTAKDGKMIKDLLRSFGLTRLKAMMLELIHTDDDWLRDKRGILVSTLTSVCNALAQKTLLDTRRPTRSDAARHNLSVIKNLITPGGDNGNQS